MVVVGAVLAAALTANPQPAHADLSLDVTPSQYEFQAVPGTSQTIPITVRNVGSVPAHVVVSLADVVSTKAGEAKFAPPGSVRYSSGKWSSVNPREFDLAPDAFTQVRYTVTVPSGASGEYGTLAFFTTRPPRRPGGFGLAESVASRIYVAVGDLQQSGAVEAVSTSPTGSGRTYAVTLKNTGSMHEYFNGYVEVTRSGANVDKVSLSRTLVGRGQSMTVSANGKPLGAGTYEAIAIVDYGGKTRVAGKTTFVVQ
jgi:P pilus assembly chaperone PapD